MSKNYMYRSGIKASVLIGMLASGANSFAEEDAATGDVQVLDEIIVTSQKRAANLQDTPTAITAFGEGLIKQARIQDFTDLGLKIPGFSFVSFGKNRVFPALRGGSSTLSSPGADNAVALFIDEVYFAGGGDFNLDLVDIERIEVLRGPQGTLNGRNTTGGSINIITKQPSDTFEGEVEATFGNNNLLQFKGYVSGPLNDSGNLMGSLSFMSTDSDGGTRNRATGDRLEDDNRSTVRGKIKWEASDRTTINLSADYTRIDESNTARDFIGAAPTASLLVAEGFQPDNDAFVVDQFDSGNFRSDSWGASIRVTTDFDSGTFTSITAYRGLDNSQSPEDIIGVPLRFAGVAEARDKKQFTQELRWTSESEGRFSWIGGLFFLYQDDARRTDWVTTYDPSTFAGALQSINFCPDQGGELNFALPECVVDFPELFNENNSTTFQKSETTSYSAYLEGRYEILDNVSLITGGRMTYDRKTATGFNSGDTDFIFNPEAFVIDDELSQGWSEFTPRAVIEWTPTDDIMTYASASRGFRSGAYQFSGDRAQSVIPVDTESVWSYELGFKSRFWQDRVQLNAALFQADYKGFQFYLVTPEGDVIANNAGKAQVRGFEVELTALPIDNLNVYVNYSYQDGETSDFPADLELPDGISPPQTPKHSINAGFSYSIVTDNGMEIMPYVDYQYKSPYQLELTPDPAFESKVDHLLNAGIVINFPDGNWSANIWGKNLTQKKIVVSGQDLRIFAYSFDEAFNPGSPNFIPSASTANMPAYAPPRTYGITLNRKF